MRRHWYLITVHTCPVCGHEDRYRERRYGRRPVRFESRHAFRFDAYDYCLEDPR